MFTLLRWMANAETDRIFTPEKRSWKTR